METLAHLTHQFLFALVCDRNVLDETREVRWSVSGQHKGVASLTEKIDEVAVVSRRNMRESATEEIYT